MTFDEKRKSDMDIHRDLREDIKEIKHTLDLHMHEEEEKIDLVSKDVIELKGDIKALSIRINGSLDKIAAVDRSAMDKIANFMDTGGWYRKLILALLVGFLAGLIAYGENLRQVKINSEAIKLINNDVHILEKDFNHLQGRITENSKKLYTLSKEE